jgi:hypothetical protein
MKRITTLLAIFTVILLVSCSTLPTSIRLLVEKGIFSKQEFLQMVKVINLEIGKMV